MSQIIRSLAAEDPHAPAIIEEGRTLTRGELDRRADGYAHVLAGYGVSMGDRVAWMMHNRAEVVTVALAAQRLGAVVVPFSYRSTSGELLRLLEAARPALVIAEQATLPALEAVDCRTVIDIDSDEFARALRAAPRTPIPAPPGTTDRLGAGASMLFTSGTTGNPKAAVRTKGDARLAEAIADGLGFGAGTRYLASGPLYHSGPWTCALITLSRGGAVALRPRFDAFDWLECARCHGITSTFITPTQLRQLVALVEDGVPAPTTLVNVVVSGEPFPAELKRRAVVALGECVVECYGCTELGPLTYVPACELLARPDSSGRPFPRVEIAAFDGEIRRGIGGPGLLRARTPMAFEGYVEGSAQEPDGSGAGWATVGDMGYVDEDGYVYLVGRADDMVITAGVNVFPADVESVILEHPGIERCAVFGLPDPEWGQVVCCAIVARRELTIDELRGWMLGRIADDKRPRRLFQVDDLPTTHTGKVSRRVLRDSLLAAVS